MGNVERSFDEVYCALIRNLVGFPQYVCSPRGQKIHENLQYSFTLTDPRARLLSCQSRAANYGFAVGEFLWYWKGKTDLKTMEYYNRLMKNFSDDGASLNSAYGYRLRKHLFFSETIGTASSRGEGNTQWEMIVSTLLKDPDSRRAVLVINRPEDQHVADSFGSKDVPCTLSLQFFVRENELHLHVVMRSNDVIRGLTYDLFSFTLLQECMLLELRSHEKFKDLKLGSYMHTAASMHLYEEHFGMAKQIMSEYERARAPAFPMEQISSLAQLEQLCIVEEDLREKNVPEIDTKVFTGGLLWMAERLNEHRRKRDAETSR